MADETAPQTSPETPYAAMGGAETVRALAHRFYDLVGSDPAYAELRALHGPELAPIADSLAGFLSGWLGGPRDWFESGRGCIFSLHGAVPIDHRTAGQWADAMARSIDSEPRVPPQIAEKMKDTLGRMARSMAPREAAAS
ncbi:globin domain-containing protein [Stakelama tenebrarum]|uniref:Globin n=1 Tax=Stakelama tenebrarum TaxID=2711215 RepID=A0A6G6Y215_9SPHN|nr:globin [Sphingosinithalassobacter tenebrarum]QIG78965.1 globin [Sphingosinithalassobacter tenebrarum]